MKMTNIKPSFLLLLLFLFLLPQIFLRPALEPDALDLQNPILAMVILKLGDELLNNVEQTLGMHRKFWSNPKSRLAGGQGGEQKKLVLMVFVQAGLQLGIVAQFLEDFGLLDSLTDCADIPDNAIAQHHTPDPVIILRVGHSVYFQVDLDFLLGEVLPQDIFNFLHEIFAFVGQLLRLYVVGDHHLLGRRELGEVDGDDLLPGFHIEHDIAEPLGVVALLDVRNGQLDPHALHEWNQPQLQALLTGGLGDIGSALDLHILGIAEGREDGHKALQHEGTAGGRVRTDMGGLAEVGEDVNLCVPHFRDPLREGREDRAQLVVNARLGPVLPDGVHLEPLVQDSGEGEGGADHLAAALVQAAIDFDVLFVHVIPILQSQQKNKQYKPAFLHKTEIIGPACWPIWRWP